MADGGSDETAKGVAKHGTGKYFRIYVPSKGMESVAHFGKPGPSYGYPGITFYTKSDFVVKTQYKIFLNSGLETIANAASQMTLISKAAVNVVGEGAVNLGSPGSIVLSSVNSGAGQAYQEVSSGGQEVPTDKGHLAYMYKRHVFYESIKSLQNWATAIDASVEVAKTAMGFQVPATFPLALASLGEILGLVNKGFEAHKAWSEALKPSKAADGTSDGHDTGGAEAKKGPDYVMLDEVSKADEEAGAAAATPNKESSTTPGQMLDKGSKYGKQGAELAGQIFGDESGVGKVAGKFKKVFGAISELNKLSKNIFGKDILGEKEKKEDGGRVVVLAEQEMFTGVGGKQVTVAAGGIEMWVPSVTDSFQVTAGGGIALKSMFKTEIFSIQTVAMEGLLGGELTASGEVQIASRKKAAKVLGPEIQIGSKKAEIPKHASKTATNILQGAWNPMVQKPTKSILLETDPNSEIVLHIFNGDREIKMTQDGIKLFFKPSNSKIELDKEGIQLVTDKKIFMKAQGGILMKGDEHITGKSNKKIIWDVGNTTGIKLDTSQITTKQGGNSSVYGGGVHKLK